MQRFFYVVGIAARSADYVVGFVVHVVKVVHRAERRVGGACKKVQTAVFAAQAVAQFHNGLYGRKYEYIVVEFAAVKFF